MENIELMTNEELKTVKTELEIEFEKQKQIISNAYQIMLSAQDTYAKVTEIMNKRGFEI